MHRIISRVLIASTFIFIFVVSVVSAAQPRFTDLESLAEYFPKDTMLYAAVRTDEVSLTTLDRLVANATTELPENMFGVGFPVTLTTAIDLVTAQSAGGTDPETGTADTGASTGDTGAADWVP